MQGEQVLHGIVVITGERFSLPKIWLLKAQMSWFKDVSGLKA